MKRAVEEVISDLKSVHYLVIIGQLGAFAVFFLYLIAPEDPLESIPSPFASRFLWTPAIPILIGVSIASLTMAGFLEKLEGLAFIVSANLVFLLIILSPQFAEPSPIAEDGWWFVQIADRYGEYGNDGTEGYLSRMLSLVILDTFSRIFPGSSPFLAALSGVVLSCAWISLVAYHIKDLEYAKSWGIPTFTFVCFLMVVWWSPLQYTAQMLSLFLAAYVLHSTPGSSSSKYGHYAIVALIPTCHLQTSLILGSILVVESFMRIERSAWARNQALVLGTSFIAWNFTIAKFSFLRQLPGDLGEMVEFWHLFVPMFAIIATSILVERRLGLRDREIWGGESGTTNLSIVIGCLLILPLMFAVDSRIGAARLVPRLLAYSIVPLCTWVMASLAFSQSKIPAEFWNRRNTFALFAALAVIAGTLSSVAHVNYTSRTLLLPSNTSECWEMTEESGIVGLMEEHSFETNIILFSHSMLPMTDSENFQFFLRLGDETVFPERFKLVQFPGSGTFYSGILETADLNDDDLISAGLSPGMFSEYYLAGEVPGACRFWVDTNDTELLNPRLNWDST